MGRPKEDDAKSTLLDIVVLGLNDGCQQRLYVIALALSRHNQAFVAFYTYLLHNDSPQRMGDEDDWLTLPLSFSLVD